MSVGLTQYTVEAKVTENQEFTHVERFLAITRT